MNIKILNSALDDLLEGYEFYEAQSCGLGDYFLDSIFSDIDSLVLHYGIHTKCFGTFYRSLSKRFPFAIYYEIEEKTIIIYAVLDCRQNPHTIEDKLSRKHRTNKNK